MSKTNFAKDQLKSIVERIERIDGEVAALGDGLFQVETRRVERFVVCPECGVENDDDDA